MTHARATEGKKKKYGKKEIRKQKQKIKT